MFPGNQPGSWEDQEGLPALRPGYRLSHRRWSVRRVERSESSSHPEGWETRLLCLGFLGLMRWENVPDWRWFHWKWWQGKWFHWKWRHLKWWQDKSQFWRLPQLMKTTPLESNIRHPPRRHRDWKEVFQKHPMQPAHLTCIYSHRRTQAATQPLDHLLGGRLRWALRRFQWHPATKSTSCQNE